MSGAAQRTAGAVRRVGLPLFALATGGFAIGTTEFATMGLIPQVAAEFAVSVPRAAMIITAYAIGVVIGAPALIVAFARLERKRVLCVLMGMFIAGHLLSVAANSLGFLVVARFVAGLPHGAFFGIGAVVGVAVAGARHRGKAIGAMMAGLTLANMIGVPVAARVGQVLGWRTMFVVVGVLGLLALLAIWRLVPRSAKPEHGVMTEVRNLANGSLWIGFCAAGIGFGGMFAVYTYIAELVTGVGGMGEGAVPLVMGLFGLAMTAGVLVGGRLTDAGVLRAVVVGFVSTGLVLVLLAVLGTHVVWLLVFVFALGVTSQILGLSLQARLMDLSPLAPALGAALCHSALNLGNAEGAFFGGLAVGEWGYLATAWVGAVLTAVGFAVFLAFGRRDVVDTSAQDLAERVQHALDDPAR